jgi:beta-lactamase regulating signal transducer with metallopeptidase domain
MNSWLLFLLKSTLVLSLLYLFFRLLMRNETFFRISRSVLLFIVFASVVIPFIYLPQSNHPIISIKLDPIFQSNTIIEKPVQIDEATPATFSSVTNSNTSQPIVISTKMVLLFIYLTGVFISLLLFVYSIFSVLRLFRKSRKTTMNGIQVMIHNSDIPAFSFRQRILISRHDYDTNAEAILTHELSHIRQGHFYDLMLMEIVKIIYWFNPLIYRMGRDLKDIHEFQADEHTINSGVDSTKYQLLIIQKCVGHQSFALANSFNHCQIKKRITMMNKSKTRKAWCWKVATFLPLFALLLMAFGKRGESIPEKSSLPEKVITPTVIVQKQNELTSQIIEIKKDGNYIDKKMCSLEEIAKKGQEWNKVSNKWILLLVDESIPLSRIDEVRETLHNAKVYFITQSIEGSDDIVYFAGDVSKMAKFTQGKWVDWMNSQIGPFAKKYKDGNYKITYSFIIDKDGKVKDGHIIKGCNNPEINAEFEKILTQIPDWQPAIRLGDPVSVYYRGKYCLLP